jgi:hypothetical protein
VIHWFSQRPIEPREGSSPALESASHPSAAVGQALVADQALGFSEPDGGIVATVNPDFSLGTRLTVHCTQAYLLHSSDNCLRTAQQEHLGTAWEGEEFSGLGTWLHTSVAVETKCVQGWLA